jgi:hypothetical protein
MKMIAVIVDELPDTCHKCIFKPAEEIGWKGNTVDYCVLLEKPMAEGARRLDCPLFEEFKPMVNPDISEFIRKYEEGEDA